MVDEDNMAETHPKQRDGTFTQAFGKTYKVEGDAPVRVPEGWVSAKKKTIIHKAPIMNTPKRTVLPSARPAPLQEGEHMFEPGV